MGCFCCQGMVGTRMNSRTAQAFASRMLAIEIARLRRGEKKERVSLSRIREGLW